MASARVKLISAGVKAVLNSEGTRGVCTGKAEPVLADAQASAPVVSGAYLASLHIEQDTTDRVAVRVVASVSYAHLVEADHGTLVRALGAAG